ncbi:hypothetical protein CspeluHIS016_0205210 [Cutaneotrichosporon spelunceum]|uniref:HIT-type domain-containing protein n=1 Tax=Cutaneotrichosporon spelunceum TaxID=1672016 RepID=A0AAD3TS77_9TREE|nr:hypothetical protein CspeluHIS016_0205210 [Cutaneotrichosporon spelunceum]
MGPKAPVCGVCGEPSKYRCSVCPVRYCSVACYKTHKESCVATSEAGPAPSLEPPSDDHPAPAEPDVTELEKPTETAEPAELRPITSLKWPPEPDPMIFSDPLRRDDPKPLRPVELERIATSQPLRDLLAEEKLTRTLAALDALPSKARHDALARLLGVDSESLARPAAAATLDRGSPPPLGDLLSAAANPPERREEWGADGWWLGQSPNRVWIGEEEKQLVKLWAGMVVREIDGDSDGAWGSGNLEWEV